MKSSYKYDFIRLNYTLRKNTIRVLNVDFINYHLLQQLIMIFIHRLDDENYTLIIIKIFKAKLKELIIETGLILEPLAIILYIYKIIEYIQYTIVIVL